MVDSPVDVFSLQQKRILVTGATSGIGLETAKILSERGAEVVLMGRDMPKLERAQASLAGSGHSVIVHDFEGALSLTAQLKRVASDKLFSGIVHCVGVNTAVPLQALSVDKWHQTFDVNVTSSLIIAKAFRSRQVSEPSASLVFMGSVMSLVGQAGISAYCASKAALTGLTKSLALELAPSGKRVNLVCPGMVQTPMLEQLGVLSGAEKMERNRSMHPLGFGLPEDVAYGCVYLLSDAAKWVTGSTFVIDGGYTAS